LLPKHDDTVKVDEQYAGVDDRDLVVAALRTLPPLLQRAGRASRRAPGPPEHDWDFLICTTMSDCVS